MNGLENFGKDLKGRSIYCSAITKSVILQDDKYSHLGPFMVRVPFVFGFWAEMRYVDIMQLGFLPTLAGNLAIQMRGCLAFYVLLVSPFRILPRSRGRPSFTVK